MKIFAPSDLTARSPHRKQPKHLAMTRRLVTRVRQMALPALSPGFQPARKRVRLSDFAILDLFIKRAG